MSPPLRRPNRTAATALLVTLFAITAGNTCVPKSGGHPEVLVVYNLNDAPDAATIATYYAARRALKGKQLCPVSLPVGQFASASQLLEARRQIVEGCICPIIPAASRPDPCGIDDLDAVRAESPISHLALVRGLPTRLYGTGWPSDDEEPSFDFYLSYLIYHDDDIFAPGQMGLATSDYLTSGLMEQASDYMILSAPPLDPAIFRDVAYGRIEAMDVDRTLALIDRTIDAENLGVRGNFLEQKNNRQFRFLQELTGSLEPACTDYITYEPFLYDTPESSWPHDVCRAGTTFVTAKGPDPNSTADDPIRSVVPADAMCTIPRAVDVGFLMGSTPGPNTHSGFNHFEVMTRWRKDDQPCTPLCANLPTSQQREACAAASTDYFRELNTDCVGTARGFMGHQVRSWPVQYYGFWPAGWDADQNGNRERTPPEIRSGGAYQDATFTDDRYLHLGRHDAAAPDDSMCPSPGGGTETCPERIAVQLEQTIDLTPALPVTGSHNFLVLLRRRHPANPGGSLQAELEFSAGGSTVVKQASMSLAQPASSWTLAAVPFSIAAGELAQIESIRLSLTAGLDDSLFDYLEIDGIEVIDMSDFTSLLDPVVGSFATATHDVTHPGDWAANAIDRLGAVAWWGSSSHHLSYGYAFSEEPRFYGAFFMGRTLGESLVLDTGGYAGIVYGDPIYRPVAVRIHLPGYSDYGEPPGLAVTSADLPDTGTVFLNVLHGQLNASTTEWALDTCPSHDIVQCDVGGSWTSRETGVGAVEDHPVDWSAFIDTGVTQDLLLRLRIWNPGEESAELFAYAFFHYQP